MVEQVHDLMEKTIDANIPLSEVVFKGGYSHKVNIVLANHTNQKRYQQTIAFLELFLPFLARSSRLVACKLMIVGSESMSMPRSSLIAFGLRVPFLLI